ncbi:MAG: putative Polyadenylate-binding protein 2 [Streblomastix strix]|uniref:Putative Polyadenylate-binding protein 2 n=1 Tax=Streblomastix strix TaxID=222440 RepID=A0A5J4U8C4_9EUKA|nr:MAG: putative Polyadenylate-binding protein 2 [Streblomastix strix]
MRHFQYVGKVVNAQVIRYNSGHSKGYGFVEMKNNRTAQQAINQLYNSLLDGRYIRIEFARSHSTTSEVNPAELYVGGLNKKTTSERLYQFFIEALRVMTAYIIRNKNGQSKGYGFVEMRDAAIAQCAMNLTNGQLLDGRQIKVSFARSLSPIRSQTPNRNYPAQLYVGNLCYQTTEIELYQLFQGALRVIKSKIICTDGISRGFGYVTLGDALLAQYAISALNGQYLDGSRITVSYALPHAPRSHLQPLSILRHQFIDQTSAARSISVQPQVQYNINSQFNQQQQRSTSNLPNQIDGNNHPIIIQQSSSSSSQIPLQAPNPQSLKCLKVSNFDISMTQEQLRQLFAKIGEVDDVRIIIKDQNRVGYVKMKYEEDAQKAVDEYDGTVIKEHCIGVMLVNPEVEIPEPGLNTNQQTIIAPARELRPPIIHAQVARYRIQLSNLPLDATKDELMYKYAAYNPSGILITTDNRGQQTDIGFIEFNNSRDKQRAIQGIRNFSLRGCIVSVTAANQA